MKFEGKRKQKPVTLSKTHFTSSKKDDIRTTMNLYPFHDVAKTAARRMAEGWDIHQQFTCSGCGVKQTMGDKNRFFTEGKCEECGHITDIQRNGCNFMAMTRMTKP
jgi:hypothetical protein